ncbi:DNA-3-methyladenine glycosylase 2 family protein [Polaromonas sp.]|uniref:DNA-3-methyladenine glycosylase 2 family protein n=1 Tax=Polaromonas sp. TaxID=1869339 RepID=UPI0013BA51EA|nr:DNA-3-methyladenine glycosylase 2 family protein [Polaromonas sp.]NDP64379.1 helix-turn-helix domain-containing protein [Polaromonas sp.]
MTTQNTRLADDDCYLALKAKDARFDGRFFTGVLSTGIYCRPVCNVKTPLRKNCRFFSHAAQAESAGFRPCLRCRPELAPHSVHWSIQDASFILAHQAARLLDAPDSWTDEAASIEKLAARLGVSSRHLRRIFEAQFGVSPLQYLQTRRLLTAKQLLADTDMPVTQVALVSGFASVRRFNAAFVQHYRLNPSQMRRQQARPQPEGITVRLGYRPPYDVPAMLAFIERHCINAIEFIATDADQTCVGRTFGIESGGKAHAGWLLARFDEARSQLVLQVSDSLREVLPLVIRRVRGLFDLDADPAAINSVLHASFPGGDGLRVPGALDGFELAVRAVLGQQVTVAAARTLAQRLVDRFGEPVKTPWPLLTRLFPAPAVLADASSDALGQLGIVRQRQAAIVGIARGVADRRLELNGGADVNATIAQLKELPGIGDWTAQYIALRALRWPDAFPAGDVALHKMLGVQALKAPAREAEKASLAWKPWRSYAVIRAWSGLLVAAPPMPPSPEKP